MFSGVVRPYTPADHGALVSLWTLVFPDDPPRNAPERMIASKLGIQAELLLVAEVDGRLRGAVMAGFDGTRGWIHHLAVDPHSRKQGIGSALIREVEEGLRRIGCPKVNL